MPHIRQRGKVVKAKHVSLLLFAAQPIAGLQGSPSPPAEVEPEPIPDPIRPTPDMQTDALALETPAIAGVEDERHATGNAWVSRRGRKWR